MTRANATTAATAAAATSDGVARLDQQPVMLNRTLPFRYPPVLYAERAEGDVTLRLYIDRTGQVINDSTRVTQSSGRMLLDSAALKGAPELRFTPAKARGVATPVSILLPVYFRHPDASAASSASAAATDASRATRTRDSAAVAALADAITRPKTVKDAAKTSTKSGAKPAAVAERSTAERASSTKASRKEPTTRTTGKRTPTRRRPEPELPKLPPTVVVPSPIP